MIDSERDKLIENKRREKIIENKKLNFWNWLRQPNLKENSSTVNKLVPGLASVLAIIVFLIKQKIIKENEHTDIFSEYNITNFFYGINIAILLFIVFFGLNKKSRNTYSKKSKLNYQLIESLENQFIKTVKCFFIMTILLYLFLFADTVNDESTLNQSPQTFTINSVISGLHEMISGLNKMNRLDTLKRTIEVGKAEMSAAIKKLTNNTNDSLNNYKKYNNLKNCSLNDSLICRENDSLINVALRHTFIEFEKAINYSLKIDSDEDVRTELCRNSIEKFKSINKRIGDTVDLLDKKILNDKFKPNNPNNVMAGINQLYHGHYIIQNGIENFKSDNIVTSIIKIFQLLTSNIGAFFIFCCFLILYSKTIIIDGDKMLSCLTIGNLYNNNELEANEQRKKTHTYTIRIIRTLIGLLLFLTLAEVIIQLITSGYTQDNWFQVFRLVSGILNALAMCLLFARFESSHFQSTLTVLIFLYLYAIIQAFFGLFEVQFLENKYLIQDITTLLAFIGKCFLYLFILWIYRTDRLMYYFYNKEDDKSSSKSSWDEFLNETN